MHSALVCISHDVRVPGLVFNRVDALWAGVLVRKCILRRVEQKPNRWTRTTFFGVRFLRQQCASILVIIFAPIIVQRETQRLCPVDGCELPRTLETIERVAQRFLIFVVVIR